LTTKSAKLVNARIPTDVDVIPYHHMPSKSRMAAHYYVIADYAIMSDMTVSEKNVVRANLSRILGVCSHVSGDVFTKNIAIPHPELGLTTLIFKVMRHTSDKCIGMNIVLFAENEVTLYRRVMANPASISD
jgi:hypothetical protein